MDKRRLRVVLADDHGEVLEEIRLLLHAEFEIAGSVRDGRALVETAAGLKPDVVISDLEMPGMNGIEACRTIISRGICNAIVLLTMYNEPHLIQRALRAGIRGYVLKIDAGEELMAALVAVLNGNRYLSREALARWSEEYAEDEGSPCG